MTSATVFKSEEGRKKVLDRYNQILSGLPVGKKFIDTTFGRTFLIETGRQDSSAVLLLHGSCSNSVFWIAEILALSEKYHVFAVDIIGEAGNSEEKRPDPASDAYALWVGEIIDGLGLKRAVIMGNSFGGWISLKFATVFPQRTAGLVLIASAGIMPVRPSFILKSSNALEQGNPEAVNEAVLGESPIPPEVLDFINLIMDNFNPMTTALPVFSDEQLGRLTMPVLFMAGKNDVIIDAESSAQRLQKILPDIQTHALGDCGHLVMQTAEIVMPFLSEKVRQI